MKIKSNRFAIIPVMCTECQQYIWLEWYRTGEKWNNLADRFMNVDVCKDCYRRFEFGRDNTKGH